MQRYTKSKPMKNAVYYKVEVENILHSVLYITCRRKDIAYVHMW